jgi:hypothetical protein
VVAQLGGQPEDHLVEEQHDALVAERLGVPGDHGEAGVQVEVLPAVHELVKRSGSAR